MIEIFVPGVPQPGGSKRAFGVRTRGGGHKIVVVDDAKKNKPWRASVEAVAAEAMLGNPLLSGPLRVTMEFRMPRPLGHYGTGKNAGSVRSSAPTHPAVKPDVLKLARSTEDALTGIVWRDDAQTVELVLRKIYTTAQAGAYITVEPVESGASDVRRTDGNGIGGDQESRRIPAHR